MGTTRIAYNSARVVQAIPAGEIKKLRNFNFFSFTLPHWHDDTIVGQDGKLIGKRHKYNNFY